MSKRRESRKPARKDSRNSRSRRNERLQEAREAVFAAIEAHKPFVGIFHTVGARAWVLMESKAMPYDIEVPIEEAAEMGAQRGMKVAVVADRWQRHAQTPEGHLVDVIGFPGDNDVEMHAILAEFGLPYRFEKEVEDAADSISEAIGPEQLKGRKDFRDTLTFTIDPADAKDFDDAISFRKLSGGNFEIGVHIADVSYYVLPGSPVDEEARSRGTSVYLVDRTVPMLPEKLCNKLCSLRAGEDKLCFSAVFEMTSDARVRRYTLGRTVIRSDRRMNYDEAQAIIETGVPTDSLSEAVLTLNSLAQKLKARRFKAGSIEFERPEMKVEVDASGKPIRVYQHESAEANFLIEEFMLLANRTVAEFVAMKKRTFVYRVHAEPDVLKLDNLRVFAGGFGYKVKFRKDVASTLNSLLASAKGKPEYQALENLALRSMAKACYTTDNIGHYGLAFEYYTHFTSPIRRYPDLMVHRLLAEYLAGGKSASKEYYEQEAKHASEREVLAADAERTSVKYKIVEFMEDKIGEEYDGTVSGVTEWGLYVAIEPTKIEGMVPVRQIRTDFFEFDEEHCCLRGMRTHKRYRLGDKVRVRVKATNLEKRQLDFELI